jgi:hypothetical protein
MGNTYPQFQTPRHPKLVLRVVALASDGGDEHPQVKIKTTRFVNHLADNARDSHGLAHALFG